MPLPRVAVIPDTAPPESTVTRGDAAPVTISNTLTLCALLALKIKPLVEPVTVVISTVPVGEDVPIPNLPALSIAPRVRL